MNSIPSKNSVIDRVLTSEVVRVAYISHATGLYEDPKTGQLSGIFLDTLEKVVQGLGLKAQYVEKIAWAEMFEALNTDRIDVCLYVWANAIRAREADCLMPLYYSPINAYAREGDKRFDQGLAEAMKNHDICIAAVPGELSAMIAESDYPEKKTHKLALHSSTADMLTHVANSEADLVFSDAVMAHEFGQNNPRTIRNVTPSDPVRVSANCMMIKRGQYEFKNMINGVLDELHNSRVVDKIIDQYEPFPGAVSRLVAPYRSSLAASIEVGSGTKGSQLGEHTRV